MTELAVFFQDNCDGNMIDAMMQSTEIQLKMNSNLHNKLQRVQLCAPQA